MKVQELRDLIKEADRELLEKAFAEAYKQFTKKQKEEINQFLSNAYAQNYLVSNKIISKRERPKWRFIVKKYIKKLEKISMEDENFSRAAKLLTDIYHLL